MTTATWVIAPVEVVTDDGNACTTDACNTLTGAVTHTAVVINDNNACTTDACNSITGVSHTNILIDDGNACTTDGCNSITGVFHDAVSVSDGNLCTDDGCNSITGVFHNPVQTDDGNSCTDDGCNSLTGIFHNQIPGCGGICINPPTANAGGPYVACGNVKLDGSVGGSATGGTWSTTTGGTFVPNANSLTAVYQPSALDISNGSVTLTLVSNNPIGAPCVPATSTALVTFTTNLSDNNACTVDACDPITGQITHTPINIYDNDACTYDACNTVTGIISHTLINTNDNDACTIDGCSPIFGVFHIPVNTNDGNACTIDGCDPLTGTYHDPLNTDDGNNCTIDACNTETGVITHTDDTPTVSVTAGTISCYGGSTCVTVTATGGLPQYFGTGVFCGYNSGNYTFEVTDSRGCIATSSIISIDDPQKLSITTTSTPSDCSFNSGTATAKVLKQVLLPDL